MPASRGQPCPRACPPECDSSQMGQEVESNIETRCQLRSGPKVSRPLRGEFCRVRTFALVWRLALHCSFRVALETLEFLSVDDLVREDNIACIGVCLFCVFVQQFINSSAEAAQLRRLYGNKSRLGRSWRACLRACPPECLRSTERWLDTVCTFAACIMGVECGSCRQRVIFYNRNYIKYFRTRQSFERVVLPLSSGSPATDGSGRPTGVRFLFTLPHDTPYIAPRYDGCVG